ncbi:UNVERIFIED_ORG: hypothetical protein ABID33_002308 [Xanthobacter viscosus]|uniref:Dabb family protein n=1 Tax=Xanthobacter autotrophicus TaxID=280 RepID=A0A6C1KBA5_XANAU|nr:Dabb family protein [Xanthobacter autotrophicus]TLX41430.1 Dabb family protein [Xanthobacter autotrophicus]
MSGPIKHVVMWRVSGETAELRAAARRKVQTAFEGLRGRIEGLRSLEVGINITDIDHACDVVLITEFSDLAGLQSYATHPEHLRVRRELGDLRTARFQVDYAIGSAGPDLAKAEARELSPEAMAD